ncbi:MAG: phenylalanine--tRNA ligase subunit beta [Granulosicoccaceae bacterium]
MKISEKWLREWINPPVEAAELAEQLTSMGLEVDTVSSLAPAMSDTVIARVENVKPHPDADRLRICEVDNGTAELVQIVCGAPNVRRQMVTVLANVGSSMPDGSKLKKAKLRGVESFGMLCSSAELGLSEQSDGLIELPDSAPVGDDLMSYLELDDRVFEIELTPNRGDCLSVRGIARDLSARNNMPLQLHEITEIPAAHQDVQNVNLAPSSACVRYAGRVFNNVDVSGATPIWMTERLRRSGVRSINPAVDITNYVMLEIGQPMHAFDLDKLQGAIQVRVSVEGEKVELLDGREVTLDGDTTVIADDSGAIGIAGIMGGATTAVDENTTRVFLESALFLPERIAGKPRHYSSHTESSHRFERGVDPELQREAIEYATGLMVNLTGGKPGQVRDWQDKPRLPGGEPVLLRKARLASLLGVVVPDKKCEQIFGSLGIDCQKDPAGWALSPPSYRYDLRIEEDFVEEIGRVYGFDNIPRTSPGHNPVFSPVPENRVKPIAIKQLLANRGFQEVVTYSFVEEQQQTALRSDLIPLALANPISADMSVMRTTLLGGLLNVMRHNQSRQWPSMKLFETGLRFLPTNERAVDELDQYLDASHGNDLQIDQTIQQQQMLAGIVVGYASPENWNTDANEFDFFDLKADLDTLFELANGNTLHYTPTDLKTLHPGQSAGLMCNGVLVGYMGRLNPEVQKTLDLSQSPVVFEVSLAALFTAKVPQLEPVSRFPSVRRDIALLVDESVTNQAIIDCVQKHGPDFLRSVRTFDVYVGEKIEKGKKSIALGLIMQTGSRTLEEAEVEKVMSTIVTSASRELGAVLRV